MKIRIRTGRFASFIYEREQFYEWKEESNGKWEYNDWTEQRNISFALIFPSRVLVTVDRVLLAHNEVGGSTFNSVQ